MKPPTERFWSKVHKSKGCWIWTGSLVAKGYGHFRVGTHYPLTHRFSWEIHNGPIPKEFLVLHKCDNPPCVRPSHLFLGTYQDNVDDMFAKNRQMKNGWLKGEANGRAKLTEKQVLKIRRLAVNGRSLLSLATEFEIDWSTVKDIVNRNIWKHI